MEFHKLSKYIFLFFLVLIAVIYASFPNKNYSYDAISYTNSILKQANLFHPHHILYGFFGYSAHSIFAKWGYQKGVLEFLVTVNILFAIGTIIAIYFVLLNLLPDRLLASLLTILFAFSYGFWHYSTEVEVYNIPLFFITLSFYLISKSTKNTILFTAGISCAIAVLFHQSHIFALGFFSMYIFFISPAQKRIKNTIFFLFISILIVAITYLLIAAYEGHLSSLKDCWQWITTYANAGKWGRNIRLDNFVLTAIGLLRNIFFVNSMISTNITNILLFAFFSLAFIVFLIANIFSAKKNPELKSYKSLVIACIFWILLYIGFSFWWEPGNIEFLLPIMIPTIVILAVLLKLTKIKKTVDYMLMTILATSLFLGNFIFHIFPSSKIENNLTYQVTKIIKEKTDEKSIIISSDDIWILYLDYFWNGKRQLIYGLQAFDGSLKIEKNEYKQKLKEDIDKYLAEGYQVITLDFVPRSYLAEKIAPGFSDKEAKAFYSAFKTEVIALINYRKKESPLLELLAPE